MNTKGQKPMEKKISVNEIRRNISWIIFGREIGNFENNKTWFGKGCGGLITTDTLGGTKRVIIYLEALGVRALKNAQASE